MPSQTGLYQRNLSVSCQAKLDTHNQVLQNSLRIVKLCLTNFVLPWWSTMEGGSCHDPPRLCKLGYAIKHISLCVKLYLVEICKALQIWYVHNEVVHEVDLKICQAS